MGSKVITSLMFSIAKELEKPESERDQEYIKGLREEIAKANGKSSNNNQPTTNDGARKKKKKH